MSDFEGIRIKSTEEQQLEELKKINSNLEALRSDFRKMVIELGHHTIALRNIRDKK